MPPDPIQVRYAGGLHLPGMDLWLDPHRAKSTAFVSHAHADHFAKHETIICSERTHALIRKRYGAPKSKVISLAYGERYGFNEDYHLHLLPAGHIFGSAQIYLTRISDGATLLYTGDFKVRQSYSAELIEAEKADTLIMETTFGLPHFRFPPTEEIVASIVKFCRETLEENEIPILFGYSLGKAQEILAALTDARLPVMLHKTVYDMTTVYEQFQETFPEYTKLDFKAPGGHVLIMPPSVGRSQAVRRLRNTRTAMLSGWALQSSAIYRYQVDAVFPLSDHADYPGLMEYVARVQPKLVYTLHGYAAEFARDLREQGTEAWSILTDNQLDLDLAVDREIGEIRRDSQESRVDCEVAVLSDVSQAVAETTGKRKKTELLANYFRTLSLANLQRATLFLSGKVFIEPTQRRALGTGWAVVRKALLKVSGMNLARYRDISQAQSDAGRTTFLVLNGVTSPTAVSLTELEDVFVSLANAQGPVAKNEIICDVLGRLHPSEGRLVVQILTNDLRIGLKEGLLEEAIAQAFEQPVATVREAHMLLGNLGQTAVAAHAKTFNTLSLQPFTPVKCMLASPESTAVAIWDRLGCESNEVWLEDKLDGIRAQFHCVDGRTELFSRDLRSLEGEFPEVIQAGQAFQDNMVLDGELIAYAEGKKLSFFDLQKRLGRKRLNGDLFFGEAIPVRFVAFDLLWCNGHSLLKEPLVERRRLLDELDLPEHFAIVPVEKAANADAIEDAFKQARLRDNEGLIAKDPQSPYALGRRGKSWLKLKKAMATLDVVVVYAEQGHGKRSHVLSDYTFAVRDTETEQLLVIGKAYSGLTDVEIEDLTEHFTKHTLGKSRNKREVEPNVILEIAFDSINPSKRHNSGYALRFPRIKAIRQDKTIDDIDTLANVRKLAEG
ncbi:ATP-dependent DNA ligase [bacterium]|nr:ATP-dependent DNA ligase [Verrucomicrobiales bacterium]MDC3254788.1 ATP-dependent DNA ligase [bacterium]